MNTFNALEQRRAQVKQSWQTPFPQPTPEELEELAQFSAVLDEIFVPFQRTPEEELQFRHNQSAHYERQSSLQPLSSSDALACARPTERGRMALELQSWPVTFRAKELDSGFVTSWQNGFDFNANGVSWPEKVIAWHKLEWIELDASELNNNERKWLEHSVHELRAAHSWRFPFTQERCCFRFHCKSPQAEERDGAVIETFP